jgi:GntR family transcriptional regulator
MHTMPVSRPPLYQRCQQDLRTRIERGEFGVDRPLPTEDELCRAYRVSRITVRRAISELSLQGLVSRRQGSGTFVTRPATFAKSLSLVGTLDNVMAFAEGVTHTLLGRSAGTLPKLVAASFHMPVAEVERFDVLYARNVPFAHTAIHVPRAIAATLDTALIASKRTSIFHLIEDRSGGSVAHVDQTMQAVAAPRAIARALGVKPRGPVLRALRAYFAHDGSLVNCAVVHYHPTHFNVAMRFIA